MDRATVASLGLAACVVCGAEGAAVSLVSPSPPQTSARAANQLYQLTVKERGYEITVRETERGSAHSLIHMEIAGRPPTFTTGTVALFKAVYDIAKVRGFEYTFTFEQTMNAPRPPNGGQRMAAKVFMTKDRRTALQALLGADYSEDAQGQFDRQGWMSVRQLTAILNGQRGNAKDPLSDLIGVYSPSAGGEPTFRVSKDAQGYLIAVRTLDGRWDSPHRLAAFTDEERARLAERGARFAAGLRKTQGSADQQADIMRIEETVPGSAGNIAVLYVLYGWFGPEFMYKLP